MAERIIHDTESKHAKNPETGEALTGQFKGWYHYRERELESYLFNFF